MCKCKTIRIEDVAYRGSGHAIIPYHKDCGEPLSEDQAKFVDSERVKQWELT